LFKESNNINRNSSSNIDVVAELTTNHYGDRSLLIDMIRNAKIAGADYIKIQKRDVDTFYSKELLDSSYFSPFGKTFKDYRNGLELDYNDFCEIENECKNIGINWFISALDIKSFEFILQFAPKIIKIPSTISEFKKYHDYIAKNYDGKIVISTGMTDKKYEEYIINKFSKNKKIYLLQCTSSYPTKPEDTNIGIIRHYRNLSKKYKNIVPGYSSHDIGSLGSMLAVAAGAKMIEKHVKIKKVDWGHFDSVAIDLNSINLKIC
jgi:Sialic acid synthase